LRHEGEISLKVFLDACAEDGDVLRGSVVRYKNPTDPVGADEWEAALR
jgi:hypothetical protein